MTFRSLAGILLLAAALTACSGNGEDDRRAEDRRAATTRARPPVPRERTEQRDSGGGLIDAVAAFLEAADTSSCLEAAGNAATPQRDRSEQRTVAGVSAEVERLRGLQFRRTTKPRFLTADRLHTRIRATVDDYPAADAAADARALVTLGALPDGTDLRKLLRRALPSQIAGFYDPETAELVVRADTNARLSGFERLILSHELEHALADQRLTIPDYLRADRPPPGLEDTALAGLSLVEGDATLTMEAYAAENVSFLDALGMLGPALAAEADAGDLPYYLTASSTFPYLEGKSFVCELVERGGWRAVNRAYRKPPISTAQIMFPNRYLAGEEALDPGDPAEPGGEWAKVDVQGFGAANLLWLFEAPGGQPERGLANARERAGAWAGGELHVWARGRQTAIALSLVRRQGERDLCASMRSWLSELAAVRRRVGLVRCSGRRVRVGIAPTLAIARRVAAPG